MGVRAQPEVTRKVHHMEMRTLPDLAVIIFCWVGTVTGWALRVSVAYLPGSLHINASTCSGGRELI